MAREFAKKFYASKQWKQIRKDYYKSKCGLCERCRGLGDIVHHKEYITKDNIDNPDITLNWGNLELLCINCHNKEHFKEFEVTREDVMFDDRGNLVLKKF